MNKYKYKYCERLIRHRIVYERIVCFVEFLKNFLLRIFLIYIATLRYIQQKSANMTYRIIMHEQFFICKSIQYAIYLLIFAENKFC